MKNILSLQISTVLQSICKVSKNHLLIWRKTNRMSKISRPTIFFSFLPLHFSITAMLSVVILFHIFQVPLDSKIQLTSLPFSPRRKLAEYHLLNNLFSVGFLIFIKYCYQVSSHLKLMSNGLIFVQIQHVLHLSMEIHLCCTLCKVVNILKAKIQYNFCSILLSKKF